MTTANEMRVIAENANKEKEQAKIDLTDNFITETALPKAKNYAEDGYFECNVDYKPGINKSHLVDTLTALGYKVTKYTHFFNMKWN
jgi:hypothetical protein